MAACLGPAPSARAAGHIEVLALHSRGCASGQLALLVRREGLRGGKHVVRTEVVVDGQHYMDERATIHEDGTTRWVLFDDHSWSPGLSRATWPLPPGRALRVELTLGRPAGQQVERQTFLIDDCARGALHRYRPALQEDGFE